jgi:hypothetical protein
MRPMLSGKSDEHINQIFSSGLFEARIQARAYHRKQSFSSSDHGVESAAEEEGNGVILSPPPPPSSIQRVARLLPWNIRLRSSPPFACLRLTLYQYT